MAHRVNCLIGALLTAGMLSACGGKSEDNGRASAGSGGQSGRTGGTDGSGSDGVDGGTATAGNSAGAEQTTGGNGGTRGLGTGGIAGSGTGGWETGGAGTGGIAGLGTGGSETGGTGGLGTGGIAGSGTGGSETGGAGTGGVGAIGGTGGTGGGLTQAECDVLEAEYRDVLAEAQQCNPVYSGPLCLERVSDYIVCGCEAPVNGQNVEALDELAFLTIEFAEGGCMEPSICLMGAACLVWTSADCSAEGTCGIIE